MACALPAMGPVVGKLPMARCFGALLAASSTDLFSVGEVQAPSKITAAKAAQLFGLSLPDFAAQTTANFNRLFAKAALS